MSFETKVKAIKIPRGMKKKGLKAWDSSWKDDYRKIAKDIRALIVEEFIARHETDPVEDLMMPKKSNRNIKRQT